MPTGERYGDAACWQQCDKVQPQPVLVERECMVIGSDKHHFLAYTPAAITVIAPQLARSRQPEHQNLSLRGLQQSTVEKIAHRCRRGPG